jgi:hypothetical protein
VRRPLLSALALQAISAQDYRNREGHSMSATSTDAGPARATAGDDTATVARCAPPSNRISRELDAKDGEQAGQIINLPIASIHETPENWTIYRKPDASDQVWLDLCASVKEHGIRDAITISLDGYIISGHRRYLAAVANHLLEIPCVIDPDVVMEDLSSDERVALLTGQNKGIRIKTDSELYLEAAATVDPEAAIRKAEARKAQVFNKAAKSGMAEVKSVGDIRRTDPKGERAEMLNAVLEIVEAKRAAGYLPTSGRHIHYSLLAKKVRTSARSNGYIYGTRPGSSTLLSKLLTDARSAGLIDADDIDDATRPTSQWTPHGTIGKYINRELDRLFANYFSDVHADQPAHIELLAEKNTVYPLLLNHVARQFRLPITSMHGYGSYPAARDVAARFKQSGKEKLVVIYVSDLDPEGLDMPASWKKYLEHDFGVEATVYRAAVTPEQVANYNLPPDAEVKPLSTRAPAFVTRYGDQCWELDSMPEQVLIEEVSKVCRAMLDIGALNRAFAREKEADIKLARIAAAVRAFVTDKFKEDLAP